VVETQTQAYLIINALKNDGIECELLGNHISNLNAVVYATVKVVVHKDAFTQAKNALYRYKHTIKEIDWDKVDIGEMEV